jgi:ribosomal protein L40E
MSPEQCNPRTRGRLSPRPGVPITELPPDVSHKVCLKCGLVYPKHRLLRYQYIPPALHREVTRYVCRECFARMPAAERRQVVVPAGRRKSSRAAVVNPAAVAGLARLREVKGGSPQEILAAHHEVLKDDPQRLSAEFILSLSRMPRGGADRG